MKKLTKATGIAAAVFIAATSCLLCGCVDLYGKKELKYMIEYMDAIPVTCHEYKLVDGPRKEAYAGFGDGSFESIITIDGIEKKIHIKPKHEKYYTLTIEEETIIINEEFMAERSSEYVTISEMWFRYRDNMDNYYDNMPGYWIAIYDKKIFIKTRFRQGGGAWRFSYNGSMPVCLFKYDIENDTVSYAGYLVNDRMDGETHIEKVES